ncbi:peptidase M50 [Oscillatoriales cyanobacterium USR001]|nr:peptidase M50 [Oscillatoriales cyanobacterium USR001]
MLSLLWLLLLSLITYFILQRGIAQITRTPLWLLWLVMMTPALIWSTWILTHGSRQPIPLILAIAPLLICPVVYWFLVYWGRRETPAIATQSTSQDSAKTTQEKTHLCPIDKAEEAHLRDCFPWSVYYLQTLEYRSQIVICRGKLRTNPEAAYQTIKKNIEHYFGDRFLVMFQNSLSDRPFFALVPNNLKANSENYLKKAPLTRPIFALALLFITLFTTTIAGAQIADVTEKSLQSDPSLLLKGLPYSIALIVIIGLYESAHYLMARFYKIPSTLPYFIPVPFFIGTLGAFTQMRTPIPHRKALFDISIAGPIASFLSSLPFLIWGLANSTIVPLSPQSGILNFNSFNPHFSLLLASLSKLTLGSALTADNAINLHPIAVAGYVGLMLTAINLMPVGQFNGGHIVHAIFGQKTSMIIGQVTRFLMLLLALLEPGLLIWAMLLFLISLNDEPALNDVSELDNWRDFCGLFVLGILLIILLPAPNGIIF